MSSSTPVTSRRRASRARSVARSRRSRRLITPLRVLAVVLIAFLLGGTVAGIAASRYARSFETELVGNLRAGEADLDNGKTDLSKGTGGQAAAETVSAKAHFQKARSEFLAARSLATGDPYISRAEIGPGRDYLAPRLAAVVGISDLGIAIADAGIDAIPIQESLVGGDGQQGDSAGQRLVAFLKGSGPQLDRLEADLKRAAAAGAAVDAKYLPAADQKSFASAKQAITAGLTGIVSLRAQLPGMLDILGANGTRTYLIEQMNPAELRAGGGFIGSYGILRVDGGKFGIIASAGIAAADYPRPDILNHCIDARYNPTPCLGHTYVRPPSVMLDFLGDKSWVLGDSNFWSDFPTSARYAQNFTQQELKTHIDGVIAITPQFLANLLQLTGPIAVPGFDFTADPKTFPKDLFEYENAKSAAPATVRKAMFTYLAPVLIDKITTLPPGRWTDLVTALNNSAASHDLQAFFFNDSAQKEVSTYGWSGAMPARSGGDFMMEVESNFGGTKANEFVSRTYHVQLSVQGNVLHHKITVDLTNSMPAGRYEGNTYYRCYVRLYYAADGTAGTAGHVVGDQHKSDETPPLGLRMVDGWQQINSGGSDTLTFSYDTPFDPSQPHDVYWQKQAGTNADKVTVTFNNSTVEGSLSHDLVIHIAGNTVSLQPGVQGSAALPGVSL